MSRASLGPWIDRLLGRGAASVTVPPLDGALKPNNLLEEAPAGWPVAAPDNLVEWQGRLLCSSGDTVHAVDPAGVQTAPVAGLAPAGGVITALAASPGGQLAIATDADGLSIVGPAGPGGPRARFDAAPFRAITAMAFADEHTVVACVGTTQNRLADWSRDLLDGGRSGSLWTIDLRSGRSTQRASGLAFPAGLVVEPDGTFVVAESWHKRVVRVDAAGRIVATLVDDLPGYPGRIVRVGQGYWLCCFAPRSQLIEFVMREPAYRKAMMEEVPPALWIAPALRSGGSVLEPMQGGALKQMGVLKPWAPTRSYGLVIELNGAFVPTRSLHSRAGGRRHGITSALCRDDQLWLTSQGGDEVVRLALSSQAG